MVQLRTRREEIKKTNIPGCSANFRQFLLMRKKSKINTKQKAIDELCNKANAMEESLFVYKMQHKFT